MAFRTISYGHPNEGLISHFVQGTEHCPFSSFFNSKYWGVVLRHLDISTSNAFGVTVTFFRRVYLCRLLAGVGCDHSAGRRRDGRWGCLEVDELLRPSLVHAHQIRILQQGIIYSSCGSHSLPYMTRLREECTRVIDLDKVQTNSNFMYFRHHGAFERL